MATDSLSIHPDARVGDRVVVGEATRIWGSAVIADGAVLGDRCNICDHTFIEGKVRLGSNVTVKCGVYLWDGVVAEDDVFIGPAAVFTNDVRPRSGQQPARYLPTVLRRGCSIGANATLLPVTVGCWAIVAAGALVTHDVPDFALVKGAPARIVAWVCRCCDNLRFNEGGSAVCSCGRSYQKTSESTIQEILP